MFAVAVEAVFRTPVVVAVVRIHEGLVGHFLLRLRVRELGRKVEALERTLQALSEAFYPGKIELLDGLDIDALKSLIEKGLN